MFSAIEKLRGRMNSMNTVGGCLRHDASFGIWTAVHHGTWYLKYAVFDADAEYGTRKTHKVLVPNKIEFWKKFKMWNLFSDDYMIMRGQIFIQLDLPCQDNSNYTNLDQFQSFCSYHVPSTGAIWHFFLDWFWTRGWPAKISPGTSLLWEIILTSFLLKKKFQMVPVDEHEISKLVSLEPS